MIRFSSRILTLIGPDISHLGQVMTPIAKAFAVFLRRADESTLSRALVESTILIVASRVNAAAALKDAAAAYKVDTDAIGRKVRQEFAAKEKAKKAAQPTPKGARKPRKPILFGL